jgi:hypothetical protein
VFRPWSKPTFEDPKLGRLAFAGGRWTSVPVRPGDGGLAISVDGSREGPSQAALQIAHEFIANSGRFFLSAKTFVLKDSNAVEFLEGQGELVLDGLTVRGADDFDVEIAVTDWPDAMISVRFKAGKPCEVLLAD